MANNNNSTKSPFKYSAPKGFKRVWTISGRWGKGRLLSNEKREQFVQIHFFRSSKTGERLPKVSSIFTPANRIDFEAMKCGRREDGSFNVLEAMSKAVNGNYAGLRLLEQYTKQQASAAAEAPAAPVAETTPAPVAA